MIDDQIPAAMSRDRNTSRLFHNPKDLGVAALACFNGVSLATLTSDRSKQLALAIGGIAIGAFIYAITATTVASPNQKSWRDRTQSDPANAQDQARLR